MPIIGFKGVMGDHSIKVQKEIFNKCIFCLFKLPKYILELIIIITIIIIIIINRARRQGYTQGETLNK